MHGEWSFGIVFMFECFWSGQNMYRMLWSNGV